MKGASQSLKTVLSVIMVSFITAVSRISGLLREAVKAYFLGTGPIADAFNIAFTIPNLFRRLTAEGAMLAAFIPYLSETERTGKETARKFVGSFTLKLFYILIGLTLIFMFFSDFWIEFVFAPGFDTFHTGLSANMLRIMFIYIVFISLAAVLQGILNYNGLFGIAAFTPIVLNLCIIGSAFVVSGPENVAFAMSWGVVVGGILQMAMLYPLVRNMDYRIFSRLRMNNKPSNSALKGMIPGVWGAGIYQANIVAGNFIASTLGAGVISALIYSNRIMELALGIFVVSMNTVFFPGFTRQLSKKNLVKTSEMIFDYMGSISFFTVPVIIGLIFTGESLISLLFERGEFARSSTLLTFQALLFHAPGMIFIGWNRLFSSVFNSYKLFQNLMVISLFCTVTNIVLCVVLSNYLQIGGIALASSISQFVQFCIMLTVIIRMRFVIMQFGRFILSIGKHILASIMMIPPILLYQDYISPRVALWLNYLILILIAGSLYFTVCLLLKCREITALLRMIQARFTNSTV